MVQKMCKHPTLLQINWNSVMLSLGSNRAIEEGTLIVQNNQPLFCQNEAAMYVYMW
jgi:hypothetical protein